MLIHSYNEETVFTPMLPASVIVPMNNIDCIHGVITLKDNNTSDFLESLVYVYMFSSFLFPLIPKY